MIAAGFDLLLCAVIVLVALAAVGARELFAAIVFFIVYGLLISIAWLRLDAIDVALAEAAIGAGLTGVLLLGGFARLKSVPAARMGAPAKLAVRALMALSGAALSGFLIMVLVALDPEGAGLGLVVARTLDTAGVSNPVTAVLLNFRAYDTLLESVVLAVALIGVWALAADEVWGGRAGLTQYVRPQGVLQSLGRALPPIGFIVGVYVVWAGSSQPGGAFQGGTILAAVGLMAGMAGLLTPPRVTDLRLRLLVIVGPVLFLCIGLAGLGSGAMLILPPDHAYGLILFIEAALTVSIAVTLMLLVMGPPQRQDGDP